MNPVSNPNNLTSNNGNGHSAPPLPTSRQDLKKKVLQQAKNDPERKLIEAYFQELESQATDLEELELAD